MTEKLASTIIPLYDEHAAAWERLRPTTLFERPWLDRFLQLTPANARLLDLGCGNWRRRSPPILSNRGIGSPASMVLRR